jgi:predicted RecA/RadA family phage recombinase
MALSADYEDKRQDGHIIHFLIYAAENIYKGALAVVQSPGDGYLRAGTDATSRIFVGVAVEQSLAVAGESSGSRGVRVYRNGVFQIPCSGATQGWVGRQMFLVDDNTVGLRQQTTNGVVVGVCVGYISSTLVKVDICCASMAGWTEESWSSSSSSSSSSANYR